MRPAAVRLIEASGRFDRSPASLLRAARRYALRSNFQVHTEVARNERSSILTRLSGWGVAHFEGEWFGEDECAIQWRKLGWRKVRADVDPLSHQGIARRSGALCISVDALFENRRTKQRVMICAFHLPNTEGGQMPIWLECVARLAEKADQWDQDPSIDAVILVGDWNWEWRHLSKRQHLRRTLPPEATFTWGGGRAPTTSGTHGNHLIDYAAVWGGTITRAELLADDASSDHRPWFCRIQLPRVES